MSGDKLMIAAREIMRQTGCSFVSAWGLAQSENPELVQAIRRAGEKPIDTVEARYTGEVRAIAPAGGTSYPINDPDAADKRLHETSNGPEKPRVDYSSGEQLLAAAKKIQAANPGMSFSRAWEKAVAELGSDGSTPSGGFRSGPQDLGGIKVTDVGPATKTIDGYPKLNPNPRGTVTSVRTGDAVDPFGPA
jgi:hypothetical protein